MLLWKVVHVQFPDEANTPIRNGYAVASVRQEPVTINCYHTVVTNLVVIRYSSYELRQHALFHCNNLNIWSLSTEDKRLGLLLMVNAEFLYDAV